MNLFSTFSSKNKQVKTLPVQENISELILYGEKELELYKKEKFNENEFLKGIYTRLIWGYSQQTSYLEY